MFKSLARSVLAAAALAIGVAGFSAAPAAAAGLSFGVTIGSDGPNVVLAQRYQRRNACAPRTALRKARRLGLNRAYIVRENRRAVVVDGRKRGRLVTVRFAQARNCPVISVR